MGFGRQCFHPACTECLAPPMALRSLVQIKGLTRVIFKNDYNWSKVLSSPSRVIITHFFTYSPSRAVSPSRPPNLHLRLTGPPVLPACNPTPSPQRIFPRHFSPPRLIPRSRQRVLVAHISVTPDAPLPTRGNSPPLCGIHGTLPLLRRIQRRGTALWCRGRRFESGRGLSATRKEPSSRSLAHCPEPQRSDPMKNPVTCQSIL